ncbi:hypothetical protein L1049_018253 [Liquidambar formosana]|uniref:Uncharacterized protein n=1 Tax=Liquidambar formosana TaxID=63359 RepID=A0AAP0WLH3_LIQFO
MASTVVGNPDKHRFNKEMYSALMKRNKHKVINLCGRATDGALHIVTIHNDTVLHMATYSKQLHLVRKLLSALPNNPVVKLNHQNDNGNTILHEAATTNQALVAAEEMLQKDRGLLRMRNNLGETALFRAAHYGKTRIFKFLADKISEFREPNSHAFFKRRDNTTVLHISILAEHFDLALEIAETYPDLITETDPAGMTGLQLLSCNPTAFKWRNNDAFKRLMYSVDPCCSLPWRKADQKDKHKYESALKLAKLLIERDTSWEATNPGREGLQTSNRTSMGMTSETPLFLATKSGCVEIVEEILNQYPQAVEHVNNEGQNILHLAIKYRQLEIFNLVKKMKIPMKRLVRNVDIHGNSILHMVGMKRENSEFEKMQNPADKLQEELQWFEMKVYAYVRPTFLLRVKVPDTSPLTQECTLGTRTIGELPVFGTGARSPCQNNCGHGFKDNAAINCPSSFRKRNPFCNFPSPNSRRHQNLLYLDMEDSNNGLELLKTMRPSIVPHHSGERCPFHDCPSPNSRLLQNLFYLNMEDSNNGLELLVDVHRA